MWGLGGALINERQDMVGCNSQQPRRWMNGWMDGWIEDSIAIVDAYKACIAIRIMSHTRDEEKDRNKDQRCLARHPKSKNYVTVRYLLFIYDTGINMNVLDSRYSVLTSFRYSAEQISGRPRNIRYKFQVKSDANIRSSAEHQIPNLSTRYMLHLESNTFIYLIV
jgi:hypothetical protein